MSCFEEFMLHYPQFCSCSCRNYSKARSTVCTHGLGSGISHRFRPKEHFTSSLLIFVEAEGNLAIMIAFASSVALLPSGLWSPRVTSSRPSSVSSVPKRCRQASIISMSVPTDSDIRIRLYGNNSGFLLILRNPLSTGS